MHYKSVIPGIFRERPNRFIAHIEIDGTVEVCHVKNTGRCRELLPAGAQVWCAVSDNPARKTKFDLVTVKKGDRMINMDSQAPNIAAEQWLKAGGLGSLLDIRRETVHGDSRFDFSFVMDGAACFLEVKGVTLETNGICAFPDAPTQRGVKHLNGLIQAQKEGYRCFVLFVIQMADVSHLIPNRKTDPAFADALKKAAEIGVEIIAVDCSVTPDSMTIGKRVPVILT